MTALDTSPDTATEALVERLFGAAISAQEIASISLGERLGLYRALAAQGRATAGELAAATGTDERYLQEWLEHQATSAIIGVNNPEAVASERTFFIPEAHLPVLADPEDLNFLTPLATLVVDVARPVDSLTEAYRTGDGIPFEEYGRDLVGAIGAINRPQFLNLMTDWLGSIPEADARLRARPPAVVADVGCGTAWSSIAIARAYPDVRVDAYDVDEESIRAAHRNVREAGLADRVLPRMRDASALGSGGPYDLITIFEAFHDMNHPVQALRSAREALAEGGSVLIADEKVGDAFAAPGDELERFNYGWSVLHCLPVGRLHSDSAGTGAVLRPNTVAAYATEAGFGHVDVLPVDHGFWRFYRLTP